MSSLSDATVTSPEIRAATSPFLSMRTVVGIALAGNDFLNPIKTESSMSVGYGIAKRRSNASAFTGLTGCVGGGGGGSQQSTNTSYTTNVPEYASGAFMDMIGKGRRQWGGGEMTTTVSFLQLLCD
jgi:hypothetical protein